MNILVVMGKKMPKNIEKGTKMSKKQEKCKNSVLKSDNTRVKTLNIKHFHKQS